MNSKTTRGQAGQEPIGRCIVTPRMVAPCDYCGRQAAPVHMPRQEHGLYCGECCPVCGRQLNDIAGREPEAQP